MSKTMWIIGSIFFIFNFNGCKKGPEVYKIGAILPLTGPVSMLGDGLKTGMELAVEDINKAGGIKGKKIEIVYEDSKDESKEAIAIYNKLTSIQNLPVIIAARSSVVNSLIPFIDKARIPLIATCVSGVGIPDKSKYVFRIFDRADVDADISAQYAAKELKLTKVAILCTNTDFGLDCKKVFSNTFVENKGTIVYAETFEKDAKDFRDIIAKLKTIDFEALYIVASEWCLGSLVKQLREMQINQIILSPVTISQPFVREQVGKALDNIYFTESQALASPRGQDFIKKYETKFGKKPDLFLVSGYAYDGVMVLSEAIKRTGYSPDKIREGLLSIQSFPGVMGDITIEPNGDTKFPMVIKKIVKGEIVDIK